MNRRGWFSSRSLQDGRYPEPAPTPLVLPGEEGEPLHLQVAAEDPLHLPGQPLQPLRGRGMPSR
jgi:hypothetical protein